MIWKAHVKFQLALISSFLDKGIRQTNIAHYIMTSCMYSLKTVGKSILDAKLMSTGKD